MIRAFIIAAQTLDGFIAREANEPATWTSGADKKFFVERTKRAGVVVMGARTFKTIGRALPKRLTIVYSHQEPTSPGVETTTKSPAELLAELEERGFKEVAICGGSSIYTLFMKSDLVETIYLTIEPRLFGQGLSLFNEPFDRHLTLVKSQPLDANVLLLEYQVNHGRPHQN